jgi:endogenous inhibitor of DNA gyrase (YacG/DUF329 family)
MPKEDFAKCPNCGELSVWIGDPDGSYCVLGCGYRDYAFTQRSNLAICPRCHKHTLVESRIYGRYCTGTDCEYIDTSYGTRLT